MVTGGQDQTKPGYRTWLLRKVSRGGEERSEKPWLSPVSAAVLAQTQLCCPWAGLALAAPPVSTHPTAATPESGQSWWHSAGGTISTSGRASSLLSYFVVYQRFDATSS